MLFFEIIKRWRFQPPELAGPSSFPRSDFPLHGNPRLAKADCETVAQFVEILEKLEAGSRRGDAPLTIDA